MVADEMIRTFDGNMPPYLVIMPECRVISSWHNYRNPEPGVILRVKSCATLVGSIRQGCVTHNALPHSKRHSTISPDTGSAN